MEPRELKMCTGFLPSFSHVKVKHLSDIKHKQTNKTYWTKAFDMKMCCLVRSEQMDLYPALYCEFESLSASKCSGHQITNYLQDKFQDLDQQHKQSH